MTGGEQITAAGAIYVFGFIVALGMLVTAAIWMLQRCGLLDDPEPWDDWDDTPGARTDRRRLLEDEIR